MEAFSVCQVDHHYPVSAYPAEVQDSMRETALYLLNELLRCRLRVVLCPAPEPRYEGHMIRRVEEENPDWYKQLWLDRSYKISPSRKPRSLIQRSRVENSLKRIASGHDRLLNERAGSYDAIIRELVFEQMQQINALLDERAVSTSFGEDPIPF